MIPAPQRNLGMVLLLLASGAFAYATGAWAYPMALLAVGALASRGVMQWRIRSSKRTIAFLLMAVVFSTFYRVSPPDGQGHRLLFPMAYALSQYFLAAMVVCFVLPGSRGLPPSLSLLGLVALIGAGAALDAGPRAWVFPMLGMLYVVASAAYSATCLLQADASASSRPPGKARWVALGALVATLIGGYVGGNLVRRYERSAHRFVGQWQVPTPPDGSGGISRRVDLDWRAGGGSREIALRVICPRSPGYLRGHVYDDYIHDQWMPKDSFRSLGPVEFVPRGLEDQLTEGDNLFVLQAVPEARWVRHEVWPSPTLGEGMFVPLGTVAIVAPVEEVQYNDHRVVDSAELQTGMNYAACVPDEGRTGPLMPEVRKRCLQVPYGVDANVLAMGRQLVAGCETTAEKIEAVTRFFHRNFTYKLPPEIPPGVEDPLGYFLRHRPGAHCQYFATGAAVLLRIADVPARLVIGFVVNEKSPYGDYWVARFKDYHAWVEAWDAQKRRWVTVEATPAGGRPRAARRNWLAYLWENIRFRIQELRVRVERDGLVGLLGWLGGAVVAAGRMLVATLPGWVLLALVALLLWRRARRWVGSGTADRTDPTIAALRGLLSQADRRAERLALVRDPAETLHHFARRVHADPSAGGAEARLAGWYVRYADLRYTGSVRQEQIDQLARTLPEVTRTDVRRRRRSARPAED